jgi:hypothetical protein
LFAGILVAFETGNNAICDALMMAALVFVAFEVLTVSAFYILVAGRALRPRHLTAVDGSGAALAADDCFSPAAVASDGAEDVGAQNADVEFSDVDSALSCPGGVHVQVHRNSQWETSRRRQIPSHRSVRASRIGP